MTRADLEVRAARREDVIVRVRIAARRAARRRLAVQAVRRAY